MYQLIIADDEPTIRNGLSQLIPTFGLPLTLAGTAADGRSALALIERVRPDLMLIDINMPYLNGLELVERALSAVPRSKTIIISGYDQFEYVRRALQLGVFDYLLKPINRAVLASTLADALRSLDHRQAELSNLAALSDVPESADPLEHALRHIHSHFTDPALSLSGLAEQMHVSNAYLSRGVKQRTGENFSDYLTRLRMEQAIALLSAPGPVMIYDVAERVGYSSQHYFCRIFKEHTGKTPSEFRKEIREKHLSST